MEERDETRKIQFTGKSSYIVSLPKQWVMDLGLKQGDQIRMRRKDSPTDLPNNAFPRGDS